jgi:hypothetical protein
MDEAIPDADDEPRVRPTGVSVIAVLAIIFGLFNFCYAPVGMGQMLFLSDPVFTAMRNDPMLYYFTMVGGVIGWFLSIVLIALGFGLWKLKDWARSGMVVYSVLAGLWTIFGGVVNMIYIVPKSMEIAMAAQSQKVPPEIMKGAMIGAMIGGGCMLVFIFGVYIAIAIYLTRANVKDAFRPQRT